MVMARMMVTVIPGVGSDRMFADLGKACRKFTDPAELMPEVGRIWASHGVTFAPPPERAIFLRELHLRPVMEFKSCHPDYFQA